MHSPSLKDAPTGQWLRIVPAGTSHSRLSELGFLPMEKVRILRRSWWRRGALVVQVGDTVFALRPDEAELIPVEVDQ